ncbi:MAG: VacB/RNase II family 3'-5' exoribonuclease, partial [Bacteroidales bacterium]|nr:VacB/RNase II family 3'-5' exoribonuclease [Bacteroidales bacterium]
TFTIDPADAKDFDDALSFKKLSNGNYEVGVHIADVSYYVRQGTPIDKEARERGTSVYLVDRTVPMLPEKLCNKLCSLRPHEDKLTFSVVCELTPKAEVKSRWIGRTVIDSDYRFDYEQAQEIIESGKSDTPIDEAVNTLWGLAKIFKDKREKAGAINFDRPEMKVDIDEKGKPIGVHQHISKESNWLIEEFMLLANRTVAEFVATGGQMNGAAQKNAKTFVYRIHDVPDSAKLERLRAFAGSFGYKMGDSLEGRGAAKTLNALLSDAKGKPECAAFEDIALRSMAKACYSTENIGHYGLAFPFYTHFTSPIRRYPDTMVHRLLTIYLDGGASQDKGYYEGECKHASERELVAADAERTSTKYKLVEYMQDKIGMEFDGHVSGVTDWGMYVEIEPSKIEGMVSLRTIRSDFFEFDEEHYRLVGKRTRKSYRLGDAVRIRVKEANLEQRLLDYELVEPGVQ